MTAVLLVAAVSALPAKPYSRATLERPRNARLIGAVARMLALFAIDAPATALVDALMTTSGALVAFRNGVLAPLTPGFELLGMHQRWGLFVQTGREALRIQVEGQAADGSFQLLYRAHHYDALGLESVLAYRRVRGIYNAASKPSARDEYEGFVSWLARRIFAERGDVRAVRVSMQRLKLGTRRRPNRIVAVELESVRDRGDV